jgi:hypothetical protein
VKKRSLKILIDEADELLAQVDPLLAAFPEAENLIQMKADVQQRRADAAQGIGKESVESA